MNVKSIFFLFLIVICLVLLSSYTFTGDFRFWETVTLGIKTGSLNIQGAAPNVTYIFMTQGTDYSLCSDADPFACQMNGNPNSVRTTTVRAIVERLTGDCDSGVTVNAYICNSTVTKCNPSSSPAPDYTIIAPWTIIKWGPSNIWCNYTKTFDLDYFKHYGNWTVNVSAQVGVTALKNDTRAKWYYIEFNSLDYPFPGGGSIPLGTVSANAWNYGLGANVTRNTGNIRLNVSWNASNFTGPGGWINVHDNNFTVQNASGNPYSNVDNYENMSSSDAVTVWFHPLSGIKRCGNPGCTQDENGGTYPNNLANYTLWWSINVPALTAGTYLNNISVNSYYYYKEG